MWLVFVSGWFKVGSAWLVRALGVPGCGDRSRRGLGPSRGVRGLGGPSGRGGRDH